jgi:hypothetical protein
MLLFSSLALSPPALLNMTMGMLGIRSLSNQLVTMSDADHIQLAQVVRLNNLKVSFCKLPADQWGSLDVRAIWYDLGNTSFVRIYDRIIGSSIPCRPTGSENHRGHSRRKRTLQVCRHQRAVLGTYPEGPQERRGPDPPLNYFNWTEHVALWKSNEEPEPAPFT